jgi:dipeptidyl aminopeptidase/acylaminoacyl peptidase
MWLELVAQYQCRRAGTAARSLASGTLIGAFAFLLAGCGDAALTRVINCGIRITPAIKEEAPRFTRDGSKLAYVDYGAGADTVPCKPYITNSDSVGLWVVDLIQGTRTRFLRTARRDFAWSPDGRRLAFPAREGAVSMGLDNGRVDTIRAPRPMAFLSWSPGGDSMAYNDGGSDSLFVLNLGTGEESFITRLVVGAVWSPDGRYLAGPFGYVVDLTNRKRADLVTPGMFSSVSHFDWCPDGRAIVFDGVREPGSIDVWMVRMPQMQLVGPIVRHAIDPACSPNGRLAYVDLDPNKSWTPEYGRLRIVDFRY